MTVSGDVVMSLAEVDIVYLSCPRSVAATGVCTLRSALAWGL